MLPDTLRQALGRPEGPASREALRAVGRMMAELPAGGAADLLLAAVEALSAAPVGVSEQVRRLRELLRAAPAELRSDPATARRLAGLPAALKAGPAAVLPAEVRPLLYAPIADPFADPAADGSPAASAPPPDAPGPSAPADPIPPADPPASPTGDAAPSAEPAAPPDPAGAVVALLAAPARRPPVPRPLCGHPFLRVVAVDPDGWESALAAADVCGFLVDGSAWAGRGPEAQEALLRRLAEWSSEACLLLDETGFAEPARIRDVVRSACDREPAAGRLQVRTGLSLSAADVVALAEAAELLAPAARPAPVSDELSEVESAALSAAAGAMFRELYAGSGERLSGLRFRRLDGGRSSAKLLLLWFNGTGVPVVAKIDAADHVRSEASRFRSYIARWEGNRLRPFVGRLRGTGVLLLPMVEDAARPGRPAPTLEERITALWRAEIWSPAAVGDTAGLLRVIERTADRLADLNLRPCREARHESWAYLDGSALCQQVAAGIDWRLSAAGGAAIADGIAAAHAILAPLKTAATVHGDVHLRNVLAPDEGGCHLIDYACAGPGHPAYDLVRLECALLFGRLRPVGDEEEFVALQRAMSVGLAEPGRLRAEFPAWWSSRVNAVLLDGAAACRDRCLRVLERYGAGPAEYRAAKFAVAAWSTAVPDLQTGLVRATLRALAPEFTRRSQL